MDDDISGDKHAEWSTFFFLCINTNINISDRSTDTPQNSNLKNYLKEFWYFSHQKWAHNEKDPVYYLSDSTSCSQFLVLVKGMIDM